MVGTGTCLTHCRILIAAIQAVGFTVTGLGQSYTLPGTNTNIVYKMSIIYRCKELINYFHALPGNSGVRRILGRGGGFEWNHDLT